MDLFTGNGANEAGTRQRSAEFAGLVMGLAGLALWLLPLALFAGGAAVAAAARREYQQGHLWLRCVPNRGIVGLPEDPI